VIGCPYFLYVVFYRNGMPHIEIWTLKSDTHTHTHKVHQHITSGTLFLDAFCVVKIKIWTAEVLPLPPSHPRTDADHPTFFKQLTLWMSHKFLGAFAKLQTATWSFVTSVRLSTWNNTAPIGRIFMKFNTCVFFENMTINFKFHQNLTRISDTLLEYNYR
jgi:hypothetical protein